MCAHPCQPATITSCKSPNRARTTGSLVHSDVGDLRGGWLAGHQGLGNEVGALALAG